MNVPDLINGSFELVGGSFLWANVCRLYLDKQVKGVYWLTPVFFAGWGIWSCFYYPWLGQWASFAGGCFITVANIVWAGMAMYYIRCRSRSNPDWVSVGSDLPGGERFARVDRK
jgi:hypothetical protein